MATPVFGNVPERRAAPGEGFTIFGTGFDADAEVRVGGILATASWISASQINVVMPSGVPVGFAEISVKNVAANLTDTETNAIESISLFDRNSESRHLRPITLIVIGTDGGDTKLIDRASGLIASDYNAISLFEGGSVIGYKTEPWSGIASSGSITLTILDKNKKFSILASSKHLLNRRVEMKIGYQGMIESDFFIEYVGTIKSYTQPSPEKWDVVLEDASADLLEKVPRENTTTIVDTAYWNQSRVGSIAVASAMDSSTMPQIYTLTQSFVSTQIRDRTMMVRVSANTFRLYQVQSISASSIYTTWNVESGTTPVADGVANAQRSELLGDNAVDIMLNIMKRVQLPDANIQVATFSYVRENFLSSIRMRRVLAKPTAAMDLLRELCEVSLVSVFPDEQNRISARYFNFPSPHEDVYVLNETKSNPVGGVVSGPRTDRFANRIVFFGNHDGSQDTKPENFLRVDIRADADSQNNNDQTKTRDKKSFWLNSSVTDSAWYSVLLDRILDRLKYPPRYAKIGTFMDAARIRVADIIDFSHRDIVGQPAVIGANTPGVSGEFWQVLEKRTDHGKGRIELEIWDAQFVQRAGWIGHAGAPDWDSANTEDKRHAYLGNASNLLNTEDGYYVQ